MEYLILYEHDHKNRADALIGPLWKATHCKPVTDPVVKVDDVATLTFWGHGTSGFLCGLTPALLVEKIKAWKAVNKKIKTVEIVTCNARHNHNTGADPYVQRFKSKLGFLLRRELTIKALPVRMGQDGMHGDSILFADYKSKTWCYLTTPNEKALMFMRNIFKAVCEKDFDDDAIKTAVYLTSAPPRVGGGIGAYRVGGPGDSFAKAASKMECLAGSTEKIHGLEKFYGYSHDNVFMEDFRKALKFNAFRRDFVFSRTYSMNYGTFDMLRKSLVEV